MDVVIDKNRFKSDELKTWLASNPSNMAVLTPSAQMESYKGDPKNRLMESLAILATYPSQVIILRSSTENALIRPRAIPRLRKLFIDHESTTGFAEYCKHVAMAHAGDEGLRRQVEEHAVKANEYFDNFQCDLHGLSPYILESASGVPASSLDRLRSERVIDRDLQTFIFTATHIACKVMYEKMTPKTSKPKGVKCYNTLPFRIRPK